jgi:hypothetical protein
MWLPVPPATLNATLPGHCALFFCVAIGWIGRPEYLLQSNFVNTVQTLMQINALMTELLKKQ